MVKPKATISTQANARRCVVEMSGRSVVVEYEPDSALRDREQVPLLEDGSIAAFIE